MYFKVKQSAWVGLYNKCIVKHCRAINDYRNMCCKEAVANLKSADIQLEEKHEICSTQALIWNGDFQNSKQECNLFHSYARNPTIQNIKQECNTFHSYARNPTIQNIKQECNSFHSYARNPTIQNIKQECNPLHSYVRDQTVSNGTLLGSLKT